MGLIWVGKFFKKPVGHDLQLEVFFNVIKKGESEGRAFLFHGPEGVGKKFSAVYAFASLVCESKLQYACGECRRCKLISKMTYPELRVLEPSGKGGQITVDQIRENLLLIGKYRPIEGNWRMVIIDEAHHLNLPAQNTLLKILEEPPESTIIVLITPTPWVLLPTIRSRTVDIHFRRLNFSDFVKVMQDNGIEVSQKDYEMCFGAPGLYIKMIEGTADEYEDAEKLINDLIEPGSKILNAYQLLVSKCSDQKTTLSFLKTTKWVILHKIRQAVEKDEEQLKIEDYIHLYDVCYQAMRRVESGASPSLIAASLSTWKWRKG